MKLTTLDRALTDKRLLDLGGSSWLTWRSVLKAANAERLSKVELEAFGQVAGGRSPPTRKVKQFLAVVSRRAGKGRAAAALAVYASVLVDHSAHLSAGEVGVVACISPTREQARIVQQYALGFLRSSPELAGEIETVSADEIKLRNGNVIATLTAAQTLRGYTLLLAVLDEASFLHGTSASAATPDFEIARALLPSLITTNGMLVILSSPYRRSGLVYQLHRDHFGQDSDDVLCVAGPSITFNPTLDTAAIEAARAADPEAAASEWLGQFRLDRSQFLDDATIDAAVDHGRPLELAPQPDIEYRAVTDSSGGRGDAYTFSIGHRNGEQFVIDVLRGTSPPFDPVETTAEYAALAKQYRIAEVLRDHYGAEWVSAAWRTHGVRCERGELTKSQIYLECLPLFTRGAIRLPDHPKLLRELRLLERTTHRSGKDTVSYGKGGSDDYCNAALGVLRLLAVSGPALWRASSFTTTTPATPLRVDLAFAVVVVGDASQTGIAYFAKSIIPASPVTLLDVALSPLCPNLLLDMRTRLTDFAKGRRWAVFAQTPVKAELERLGVNGVEMLDALLADPMLAVSAAVHISGNRVQICPEALAKDFPLGFLRGAATPAADDPLSLAVLCGICLTFDIGRSLQKRRAAA
jgi:hypothetical protein